MPLPTALEQSGLNNGVVVDTIDSLEGPFSLPGTHSPNVGSFMGPGDKGVSPVLVHG